MNEKIKDGGPAFPVPDVIDHDRNYYQYGGQGMTLRDYFAAKALNAVCERYMLANCNSEIDVDMEITNAAAMAYRLADAMLKAREVQP